MSEPTPPKGKSRWQSKIDSLSEAKRQGLFKLLIITLSIIVVLAWIPALKMSIDKALNQPKNSIINQGEITEMKQDLERIFSQTQQGLTDIQRQIGQLDETITPSTTPTTTLNTAPTSTPSTTPDLTDQDLERLKEKILERLD